MTTTTHLGLTLVEQSQAQKEVTVNTALTRIDAMLNTGAKDKDLSTPPGSPAVGDVYIVAGSPTGDWSGQAKSVAYFDQIWRFVAPREGLTLWVNDEDKAYTYDGSNWVAQPLGETNTASNLGSGEGVFASKSSVDLRFKSLVAGTNVTLTATSTEITIDAAGGGGGGSGDVTGPASSVDSEVALFSSTTGKIIKRASGSGIAKLTSGVLSTVASIDLSGSDASGTLAAGRFPALTGDITTSAGAVATTIANDAVTFAKMQNIATDRLVGRDTASTGDPEELTVGGGIEFTGSGGIQRSALTGDVTASAGSNSTTIANDAVTYAKMQNVSATDKILGRSTSGAGDVEEIACTAAGRALIDDADAAAQRTTLGLGTAATQATSAFEVPLTFSTGLTRSTNTITVNTSQNIAKLSNLTSNGFVKTGSGDGTLSVDTSTYLTGNQSISLGGDLSGSGATSITATIANDAVTFAKMQNIATDRLIGRDTASSGDPEEITVGGGLEFSGSGGIQRSALTGDVTASAGSNSTTIANDAVTYAKMQNISATSRVLGRKTSGSGDTEECTLSELLDFIGSAAQGDILYRGASAWARLGAGTNGQFLKTQGASANPTWADAAGGGTVTSVDLTQPAAGITVSGGPITSSGSITLALANDLSAVEGLSTNGIAARTATSTWTTRSIAAGTGLSVSNGDGVSGNPTINMAGGKQTLWIPAAAMRPSASGGCAALALVATSANRPDLSTLDFDATTEEYAQFWIAMPKSWDEGTVTAQFLWSHPSTATNFGVVWGLQGVAISDDDTVDAAYGTAQTVTDTGGTTSDLYITSATSAITLAGSPAEGDMVAFRVYRKAADASDTMTVDARLHGVRLFFTTNAGTDD